MSNDARLVYSSDPEKNKKCPKCKELILACTCQPEVTVTLSQFVAKIRLEKQHRGGKTVTVIDDLPKQEKFLKELSAELKKKCGAGGTYSMDGKEGLIEIQGDKRTQVVQILSAKGIRLKGDFRK